MFKPIFLIASERSGTNFFRSLINSNSNAYFPHNPNIFDVFENNVGHYSDLEEFVFDVVGLIRFNHDPWEFIPDEESVLERLDKIDLFETIKVVYQLCAEHYNVDFVGIKNIRFAGISETVNKYFPEGKFIYQFRDPRDYSLSWLSTNSGPKHVYNAAIRWNEEQEMVYRSKAFLEEKGVFWQHSYEEIITNTESVLEKVCNFLGMDFEPAMMEYYKSSQAQKSSKMHHAWNNLAKPVMKDNFNKWEGKLSDEQIAIIERVCYKHMDRLGYKLKNSSFLENAPEPFTTSEIESYNRINEEERRKNFITSERNFRKERKDYYRKCLNAKFQ